MIPWTVKAPLGSAEAGHCLSAPSPALPCFPSVPYPQVLLNKLMDQETWLQHLHLGLNLSQAGIHKSSTTIQHLWASFTISVYYSIFLTIINYPGQPLNMSDYHSISLSISGNHSTSLIVIQKSPISIQYLQGSSEDVFSV